ncbi:putative mediator of RNA polymerase II transcription subunit 26 [Nilaparvata lugens]|uniref:Cuticular protein n=1 Tax=Nilaparvata lugens TaxID=108931 RepID=A0A2S1ZSE5_NILLU|nr:putative mediator of RNA polymerase II transcription subunit 26 [Nilaparvata lugens]AWK28386.1 cuticular protein [Nilaparvata lugens]
MKAMRTSKAFLLIVALCTVVPSLNGQVPVNVDPNQQPGLQKFFLVPESVLAQIPHQNKIIPIPQNIVSTAPGTVAGQPTFHAAQNSQQNPSRVSLTAEQAEQAKKQEAFRNQAIEANRKAAAQRQRQEQTAPSNQFSQNPTGQFAPQNDQFFANQQHQQVHQVQSQVQPQVQPDGFRNVQTQTPTKRVKLQRQKAAQAAVQGQQPRVQHHQSQQPRAQHQQFQQPQVQQQQFAQPQVQQQFQQPQQQFQQAEVQQQQFAPVQQTQFQPQQAQPAPPVQRQQVQQPAAASFISSQHSTETQRRPADSRSQALRDEEEIHRHQAENAKYSFATAVNDGINDQQHIRQETRDGLKLSGLYSYSDGFYKRTIHYEADENGYRVINEEIEPIGNGPISDPSGTAEVSSDVGGASLRYSISGQDFPPNAFTGNEQDAATNFQRI